MPAGHDDVLVPVVVEVAEDRHRALGTLVGEHAAGDVLEGPVALIAEDARSGSTGEQEDVEPAVAVVVADSAPDEQWEPNCV